MDKRRRLPKQGNMRPEVESSLRSFLVEVVVYAALVTGYYFLVLHFLGGWLHQLFTTERRLYAVVALLLIIGQGMVLEMLTRLLLGWLKRRTD
jgi:hypothetical protein